MAVWYIWITKTLFVEHSRRVKVFVSRIFGVWNAHKLVSLTVCYCEQFFNMKHRIFCCTRKRTGSCGSHTRLFCELYAHYILEIFVENSRNSRRRESFRFQRRAEIKRSIPLERGLNMHFPPKIRQFLPSCDNCVIKTGRKQVKKFGQPWLILTVQYLVCILTAAIFVCVSGQRT